MNLAIVVGVSEYLNASTLEACDNDIAIMKNVLNKLDKYEDICFIGNSPKAYDAKQEIIKFIEKYKNTTINELFFYFTGHGYRNKNDFFYVFNDFNEQKIETTSLRNTELDGLIKNLKPTLTIKVVDACFSGTTYIKSNDETIEPIFRKSAQENEFNNLYFLYSSNSEEESLANKNISFFSESFFKSISQRQDSIRYRDIMAYIADDMSSNDYPQPIFITQADNTEIFGDINSDLFTYLGEKISRDETLINTENITDKIEKLDIDKSLLTLIKNMSDEEYCNKNDGYKNIASLRELFGKEKWKKEIIDIFDIEILEWEREIPNKKIIVNWLMKNSDEKYFVKPTYKDKVYYKNEYVEVPRKPNTRRGGLYASLSIRDILGEDEKDYKLEKVEKTKQVLESILFTAETPFEVLQLQFKPKYEAIENYSFILVPIFSRKYLVIFNSIELLEYTSWDKISSPKCEKWKVEKFILKDTNAINSFCTKAINDIEKYLLDDIKLKLSK